jgi:hypothetical protein
MFGFYQKKNFQQKPVIIKNENQKMYGFLHLPPGRGKKRGIIMLHGFTGDKVGSHRMFVKIARRLCQHNFCVLRFDFRGSGESEGDFKEMTIKGEISDAFAALDFFCRQKKVEANKIGVLGFSLGGCVAAYLAGGDKRIKSCLLLSPAANLRRIFLLNLGKVLYMKARGWEYFDWRGNLIGRGVIEEHSQINPLVKIKNYQHHLLIIHGSKDEIIPFREGKRYYTLLKNRENTITEFHLVKEANHTYASKKWEDEVLEKTVAWFQKSLPEGENKWLE